MSRPRAWVMIQQVGTQGRFAPSEGDHRHARLIHDRVIMRLTSPVLISGVWRPLSGALAIARKNSGSGNGKSARFRISPAACAGETNPCVVRRRLARTVRNNAQAWLPKPLFESWCCLVRIAVRQDLVLPANNVCKRASAASAAFAHGCWGCGSLADTDALGNKALTWRTICKTRRERA
jgi:hypothetical protein